MRSDYSVNCLVYVAVAVKQHAYVSHLLSKHPVRQSADSHWAEFQYSVVD